MATQIYSVLMPMLTNTKPMSPLHAKVDEGQNVLKAPKKEVHFTVEKSYQIVFFQQIKHYAKEGKDGKMPCFYPLNTNHGEMRCLHYVVSTCCCPRSVVVHRRRNQGRLFPQYYVLSNCCFLHQLSQVQG